MTKKLVHVLIVLIMAVGIAISYLGSLILPVKIATLVSEEIERSTGKKVLIESVNFDIFKGLVLGDLIIYDRHSIIVWAKSASCGISIWSLFERNVTPLSVTIDRPAIYLERRPDGSFNLEELFPKEYKNAPALAVVINRIHVRRGRIIFIDRTVAPAFKERIDDVAMDIAISAPDKVAMDLSCSIPFRTPSYLNFSGVYSASLQELAGRIHAKGLVLKEFKDYYKSADIDFPSGVVDASADLIIKDNAVTVNIEGNLKDLHIDKEKLKIRLDSLMQVMVEYDLKEKAFEYAGKLGVHSMDIAGVEAIGPLENIKADIEFNDSRLWSENVIVDACGMRWKSRINIINFANPILDVYADSSAHLGVIQKMLKDEFKIVLPTEISGKADIQLAVQAQPDKPVKMNGYVMLHDATASMGAGNFPLENINGQAQFNLDGIRWSGIKLQYREVPYTSSGKLVNFASPSVELEVVSRNLSFRSAFGVKGNRVRLSSLRGNYFGSSFTLAGQIDLAERNVIDADIKGALELQLTDLRKMVKDPAQLEKINPAGRLNAKFTLNGNANDLKNCDIRMKVKADRLFLSGLTLTDMALDYSQSEGAAQMRSMRARFYGGSLFATAKINWMAKSLPYSINLDAKDVKLEEIKADTGLKDKTVSGDIMAIADLSGTFKDVTKVYGTGRISITNGKLWQLNLFKGIGSLIFTDDFSDIMFTEGACDLKIADKSLLVKNFVLKSSVLNLYGSGVIGPDKAIDAIVHPEIKEDAIGGTKERIAMAVSSNTVIKITGTFEKPEFKTQANFADVVGGIAGAIFQQ